MFKAFKRSSVAPKTETIHEKQGLDATSGTSELYVVTFKIFEATDLKSSKISSVSGKMPYLLLEYDKNQVILTAKDFDAGQSTIRWNLKSSFDISKANQEVQLTLLTSDSVLGSCKLTPNIKEQLTTDEWVPLISQTGAQAGLIRVATLIRKSASSRLSIQDYNLLQVIGKGSFGKVMQVCKKDTGRIYAMKIIKKSHVVMNDEVAHTLAERNVLSKIIHPFIVPLQTTFQTPDKLYLVLAFVNGGELFHHLQKEGKFSVERSRFYAAELLSALECLHEFNIVYRDLKPENILLDWTGHIALCDFGLCKLNMAQGKKTNTFCGTPEYLAPEILLSQGYGKEVDWWTFGILLYEMLTGLPAFYDSDTAKMYQKILKAPIDFKADMPESVVDLLSKLLERDPIKRLGSVKGANEIKCHPFFSVIDWDKLIKRQYVPEFRPEVSSLNDTSNFDAEFTTELPQDSISTPCNLSKTMQQQFAGFTFKAPEAINAGSMATSVLIGGNLRKN